jgi:hypothetical protein
MIAGVPLRRRLLLLAAAGLLPIAAMSAIALAALWFQQREQAARTGLEIARALSTAVDAELSRSLSVLQALATAGSLDAGDLRSFQRLARQVRATRPSWQSILVHDAALCCSARPTPSAGGCPRRSSPSRSRARCRRRT